MSAVPGRIGPLITTGVALSVAAVVVANPVVAPRPDVQIPAVKLSGTGDAMDMLNTDFLSALGTPQADSSNNPFTVLKELVSSLAADVSYLGRNAIISAFFAGATAVTHPELTAASYPYIPHLLPVPDPIPGNAIAVPAPVVPTTAVEPVSAEDLLAAAAIPAELVPAAAEVVMTLVNEAGDLGEGAVTVAFAAGALLVAEGGQLITALTGLVTRDIPAALGRAVVAVASGDAQRTIFNAIRGVIEDPSVVAPADAAPVAVTPPVGSESSAADDEVPISTRRLASPLVSGVPNVQAPLRLSSRQAVADGVVARSPVAPAPDEGAAPVLEIPGNGPDGDIGEPGPAVAPLRPRVPAGPLADALAKARQQTQGMARRAAEGFQQAADRVAKAVGKPAGR